MNEGNLKYRKPFSKVAFDDSQDGRVGVQKRGIDVHLKTRLCGVDQIAPYFVHTYTAHFRAVARKNK